MGLIRSGQTEPTPEDDEQLGPYLRGIARRGLRYRLIDNEYDVEGRSGLKTIFSLKGSIYEDSCLAAF